MRLKLLKGFAVALFCGFGGAIFIVIATYPNVPKGSFYNITNWTLVERIFSIPISVMYLSLIAIIILSLIPILQKPKEFK